MTATYPKIQTAFKRDPATKMKTLLMGEYAMPEFEYLAANEWVFTEKVDGTNIRLWWEDGKLHVGGKTDNAQIHAKLLENIYAHFDGRDVSKIEGLTLYCEGYGPKIQSGGKYREDQGIVLFDVFGGGPVYGIWLERHNVEDIAKEIGLDVVPVLGGPGTLEIMITACMAGFTSKWGEFPAEGIVARPATELLTRTGDRIITKLKCKDFPA